jgi:hypothetical protein
MESPIVPYYALLGMLTSKRIHLKGKGSLPITLSLSQGATAVSSAV